MGSGSIVYTLGDAARHPLSSPPRRIRREVTKGLEVLSAMEQVETRKEGIFVMPKDRITISSTYTYYVGGTAEEQVQCWDRATQLSARLEAHMLMLQEVRQQDLPGRR